MQGKIRQDGSGLATFKATFQCITFRPFKDEVLDCLVSSVNKVGNCDSS
jgi:DNA-directed RNA polymerase II subunit RPB7